MSDVGTTTFGYIVAYLLPGLLLSIAAAFYSPRVASVFEAIIAKQNLALGLLGTALAITAGVFLTLIRGLIFEELVFRNRGLSDEERAKLAEDEQTFRVFRELLDELYRYHQFWGGMALVLPVLVTGLLWRVGDEMGGLLVVLTIVGSLILEVLTVWAAYLTYARFLKRAGMILDKQ